MFFNLNICIKPLTFCFLLQQHALIPQVKTLKRDGMTTNNPYVAFRRRTEKMQTRKARLALSDDLKIDSFTILLFLDYMRTVSDALHHFRN